MVIDLLAAASEDPRLKAMEPSIIEAIKVAKMSPNGIADCSLVDGLE